MEIGKWMENRGLKPWPKNNPPEFSAELVVGSNESTELRILD